MLDGFGASTLLSVAVVSAESLFVEWSLQTPPSFMLPLTTLMLGYSHFVGPMLVLVCLAFRASVDQRIGLVES